MTTTYTFDGTTARLDLNAGILTIEDTEIPGGKFDFYHDNAKTLSAAVAGAMPGYIAAGSFTPFLAGRVAWIACKVANRATA